MSQRLPRSFEASDERERSRVAAFPRAAGDDVAATPVAEMFAQVYDRLKAMAGSQLRRSRGHTLDTTTLVHELFVRLSANRELAFERKEQFFCYVGRAMRHLLADRARHRMRGGMDWNAITLDEDAEYVLDESAGQALRLDAAIARLEAVDERAARVLELYFFAGLHQEQIAELLGLTRRTVNRDWRFARAFLRNELD